MGTNEHTKDSSRIPSIGFVIIGRNEGERLHRCIASIQEQSIALQRQLAQGKILSEGDETHDIANALVYVDSGSTDGSVEYAISGGCETLHLNGDTPFTAARARNAGFDLLVKKYPMVEWVQFIDGDCSLQPGWLSKAAAFLALNPRVAIVCGRRREVYPQKSIYNALCDMEWDTAIGEAKACGGDFLARRIALERVKGFNPSMIAGEEPEMCFRLRKESWSVWRIAEEMTSHDAAMTTFRQFWLRNKRAGFAYAERCAMHATKKRPYCVREVMSICFWACALPAAIVISTASAPFLAATLFLAYPAIVLRIFLRRLKLRNSLRRSAVYSLLTQVAKFPQFTGVVKYIASQLFGRRSALIEYK